LKTPTNADDWISVLPHQNPVSSDGYRGILFSQHHRFLLPLLRPGINVIEAGCGYGKNALAFAAYGAFSVGLDFAHEFTRMTLQHAGEVNIQNVSAATGNIMDLPFQDESFHLYTSFGVYEHFHAEQQRKICLEAYRILKPGGYVYIQVPHFWSLWTLRREIRYWYRRIFPPRLVWQRNVSRKSIINNFENCGFQTVETHVFEAWLSLESGLSLYAKKIMGVPNPLYPLRGIFQKIASFLDAQELLGYTLVYIGKKPGQESG
jgi:ubiquinone/menaquinone biosynthesis C-methylase UbiE